jgi:ribonuclease HI
MPPTASPPPTAERSNARVVIYTDGACRGNPGPGGWGAVLSSGDHQKEIKGAEPETTNNRMELTAAIQALAALKRSCDVVLYTDSQYVRKGILEWLPQWKLRDWRTADRKPVKNVDLWQALEREIERHRIEWHWVKGHAGVPGNERADQLANEAIDKMLNGEWRTADGEQ